MLKFNGSQVREPLTDSVYILYRRLSAREVVLEWKNDRKRELWALNNDYAGYVVEINGQGYEFVRGLNDPL